MTELFLESEFQHKGNKRIKNASSQSDTAVFSEAIDAENKIIQILNRKGQKIKLDRIVIVRTEPTFKFVFCFFIETHVSE